ncbi:MAG: hypothetical protein COX79_05715 [Candidatus Levybacteria bacterium CG_4_10_14_0_2_um_filter_36_16]|nr:MAG: hypothetical protein AUK12_01275 [Candidatus Levybacteria bacterium CG2_30_37_29]PIR78751.1 MAG: hypothetical protein COU26_04930 [Candidatus Levybacteria bacterium CG10_big_fil_rev_8_21_14_0_10_36_30]PIZ96167.1 MAG: hypothetical protein COX79_05715 [Candidatus Levybacteria bacterium CG_4_10_14_0_2_um_filter_36_16]PJA90545.1 MAG: hypothetical protein CO136_01835 [Candidatus Levybacteria bacterium CG_4_9_14_3_um_filter_36_7]
MTINKAFKQHENEWVLTDRKYSKVILSNKDLGKLQKEVKKKKVKDAVVMFIPPFDAFITS